MHGRRKDLVNLNFYGSRDMSRLERSRQPEKQASMKKYSNIIKGDVNERNGFLPTIDFSTVM